MTYNMLSLENVQHMVDILRPEIIESPTFLNADVLSNLGINAITGLQFQETQMIYIREAGTTRRYDEVKKNKKDFSSNSGRLIERKLEVTLSINKYSDNVQNYREKQPFAISAENTFEAPNSELAVRSIVASYCDDIFANLFFGDKSDENPNRSLSLYDGFYTHLKKAINKNEVTVVNGANIVIGATDKASNWYSFKSWINSLPTRLKAAKELIVMMTDEAYAEIIEGYMTVYSHLVNINNVDAPDFRFTTIPNVKCVHHPVMGKGSFMVATIAGNLDFGVDSLNNQTQVFVEKNPWDLNEYMFQIQSAQGTRVRNLESYAICVNNANMNTPLVDIQGDYMQGTITLVADEARGSITSSVSELGNVAAGTSITLTAVAKSGYKFKAWSDGTSTASRTWIATGAPTQLTAYFEVDE